MKVILFVLLVLSAPFVVYGFSPQPPQEMELKKDDIMVLGLNREMDTFLVFPEEIEHLSGKGLTDGKDAGKVQYQVSKNHRSLILKPLERRFSAFMKVSLGKQVYVIKLVDSESPATVVHFYQSGVIKLNPTPEITNSEVEDMVRLPSKERQKVLMDLVQTEAFLRPKVPEAYSGGYESREVFKQFVSGPFGINLERVVKIKNADSLFLCGSIVLMPEATQKPMNWDLKLTIGEHVSFRLNNVIFANDTKHGKPTLQFIAMLVGDGNGKPAYISLDNEFYLEFSNPDIFITEM